MPSTYRTCKLCHRYYEQCRCLEYDANYQRHRALDGLRDDPILQGPGMQASPTEGNTAGAPTPVSQGQKGALTHEGFIQAIRDLAATRLDDNAAKAKIAAAKLVYGRGEHGVRGTCYYNVWSNGHPENADFIEVSALGEENPCQLAGTTLHELGHVIAGHGEGHSKVWHAACLSLGLLDAKAAAQEYKPNDFDPTLWEAIRALDIPQDGRPNFGAGITPGLPTWHGRKPRACPAGIGRKGGKTRGKGSGSRLRLYHCTCTPDPSQGITNKARVASDVWQATCSRCNGEFKLVPKLEPQGIQATIAAVLAGTAGPVEVIGVPSA